MTSSRTPAALGITFTLLLACSAGAQQPEPPYSLKAVEARPIPRDVHFRLWREVALQGCSKQPSPYNLTQAECTRVVTERTHACEAKMSPASPALVTTSAVSRDIGSRFLDCATPFYFCQGVEVKTVEEARAKCK